MDSALLKTVTWDLPFSSDQIRFYLYPLLFLILFIPFSITYFVKHKKSTPFYPFSMADYSLKWTKDKLFQIEDRLGFLRLLMIILLALTFPCPTLRTPSETHLFHKRELPPTEGSVLFILLDQSGSMARKIGNERFIDILKGYTANFIQGLDRDQPPQWKDMIGLVGFARYAYVIVPPTFEHDILLKALDRFDVLTSSAGEGTSISYALYKTAHLIHFLQENAKEDTHFRLDSSAILLVTDGVEVISPEDVNKPYLSISMDEASAYAAKNHIPLYLAIIFPELRSDTYAPQRKNMEAAARRTGGELFILNNAKEYGEVLNKIEGLKKAPLGVAAASTEMIEYPLWPYLFWVSFLLLLLYSYLSYGYYRMAP